MAIRISSPVFEPMKSLPGPATYSVLFPGSSQNDSDPVPDVKLKSVRVPDLEKVPSAEYSA